MEDIVTCDVRDCRVQGHLGRVAGAVDCDVHPTLQSGIADLYPYMPSAWRERFQRKRAHTVPGGLILRFAHPNGAVIRDDSITDDGRPGGTDPRFVVTDLLEAHNVDLALLNSTQVGGLCGVYAGADESIIIATSANDYFLEQWLPIDSRFAYAMAVSSQDPLAAAREVQRVGSHKQIAAVAVPPIDVLLGNRYWWPLLEAAQEFDLPIMLHATGSEGAYVGGPTAATGRPDNYAERYVTISQSAEANLNSLIMNGVFERFPRLRVLFAEYGFLWSIALSLRMDRVWRSLRHEIPWVKREPSSYISEHIWFTTQPVEEPRDTADLQTMMRMVGMQNICFSSDYPHWDNDMPARTLRVLNEADRNMIMRENARKVLRNN